MARTGKTRQDWVQAGQALLIDGGIDAVKLHCLTAKLGVSTGSFYHHFKNFDSYLTALADFYGSEQAQLPVEEALKTAGDDPEALLREAANVFGRGSMRQLNVAMRAWGHRDERAHAAVQRYDKALMAFLDQTFLALGFDELAAKARTLIMLGLASLEIDRNLQPSFAERWYHIREMVLAREPLDPGINPATSEQSR